MKRVFPVIYMDSNYFYIISVKVGDKVYPDENVGLNNMINMMSSD